VSWLTRPLDADPAPIPEVRGFGMHPPTRRLRLTYNFLSSACGLPRSRLGSNASTGSVQSRPPRLLECCSSPSFRSSKSRTFRRFP
jgi:hypothetical protein